LISNLLDTGSLPLRAQVCSLALLRLQIVPFIAIVLALPPSLTGRSRRYDLKQHEASAHYLQTLFKLSNFQFAFNTLFIIGTTAPQPIISVFYKTSFYPITNIIMIIMIIMNMLQSLHSFFITV
jgi:hypothetical protein